jgi:hypothetical protein
MRAWVSALSVLSVGLLGAAPLGAQAPKPPLELQYQAPEPCPRASAFLSALIRLVGSGEQTSRRLTANVNIRKDAPDDFTLRLTTKLDGISGERVLNGRSCSAVADAAVVTLAIILNPDVEIPADAGIEAHDQPVKPPYSELVPVTPHTATPPPPATPTEQSKPIGWILASGVGLHFGTMPQPGPEISLGLGAKYRQLSVIASGLYAPPETSTIAGKGQAGGRLWHWTLTATSCLSFLAKPPSLGACAGGAFTHVQGRGVGVTESRRGSTSWFSPTLGIFADFPLRNHAAFRLIAVGEVPLARPNTHLDDMGTVQRPAALTARLEGGVIVNVP